MVAALEVEIDRRPGPWVSTAAADKHLRVICGPGFVWALCRGDNSADRLLARMLLAALADRSPSEAAQLIDGVVPAGQGTFMIWPDPQIDDNTPLEPPPLVHERDRHAVSRELAAHVIGDNVVAVVSGEDARAATLDLFTRLEALLQARLSELAPSAVRKLVALNQRALVQSVREDIGLPARAALPDADEYLGTRESVHGRNLALRFLLEALSARPPTGEAVLSLRRSGWLRAAAELLIELGSATDALASGRASGQVVAARTHGIALLLDGALPEAHQYRAARVESAAPALMAAEHDAWWGNDLPVAAEPALGVPIEHPDAEWRALEDASRRCWGIGFEQLLRVLRALSELADQNEDGVALMDEEQTRRQVAALTCLPEKVVQTGMARLTLAAIEDWRAGQPEHMPWRANRERSLLRCPLLRLADTRLCWSSQQVLLAGKYLVGLVESGRLRGERPLREAVRRVSEKIDRCFEDDVAARLTAAGWQTQRRLKKLGGLRLERNRGQDLGDIDVLAFSPEHRCIWLLEVKRLAPGLDSLAIRREARALAGAAAKHAERVQWVEQHRARLTRQLDSDCQDWRIRAAIVLERPLAGAYLDALQLPAYSLLELPEQLSKQSAAAL
jgi:hypothetical protein